MDALKAIFTRRSIRKYKKGEITEDQIRTMLEAGMSAPSAGNQQPWHFIVIKDREILDKIPEFHPYSKMLEEAGAAIVVCGDLEKQIHEDYWVQDCSAATENILLAAHAVGLGAVWLGVYPREDRVTGVSELLEIPVDILPLCIISIGHPDEEKGPSRKFIESRVHYDRW